jgi:hypothetical protein
MARSYKVLGQSNPTATTDTTLYTVPGSTETVVSTISICNLAATAATYRIAVRPNGVTLANQHYITYDASLPANDTAMITVGLTLDSSDIVTVRASSGSVVFGLFGSEIS